MLKTHQADLGILAEFPGDRLLIHDLMALFALTRLFY